MPAAVCGVHLCPFEDRRICRKCALVDSCGFTTEFELCSASGVVLAVPTVALSQRIARMRHHLPWVANTVAMEEGPVFPECSDRLRTRGLCVHYRRVYPTNLRGFLPTQSARDDGMGIYARPPSCRTPNAMLRCQMPPTPGAGNSWSPPAGATQISLGLGYEPPSMCRFSS